MDTQQLLPDNHSGSTRITAALSMLPTN